MIRIMDAVSHYLAQRKGLLPLVGCVLVLVNFVLEVLLPGTWMARTSALLHLGILTAIFGLLLARVL